MLRWVLGGLSGQREVHEAFETGAEVKGSGLLKARSYNGEEVRRLGEGIFELKKARGKRKVKKAEKKKGAEKLFSKVKANLGWRYEWQGATEVRAKDSVTAITRRGQGRGEKFLEETFLREPIAARGLEKSGAISAAEVGSATHLLISKLEFEGGVSGEQIEKKRDELIADGAISEAAGERIDVGGIAGFFESGLGKEVLGAERVMREWSFTYAAKASEVGGKGSNLEGESVIVEGIVDLLAERCGELLVIDFKTDNVGKSGIKGRAEGYRRQLELYAEAAEAILGKKVSGRWVYFLRAGEAVSL
jgi:ATP-dependent helicase/nuclease subunit A